MFGIPFLLLISNSTFRHRLSPEIRCGDCRSTGSDLPTLPEQVALVLALMLQQGSNCGWGLPVLGELLWYFISLLLEFTVVGLLVRQAVHERPSTLANPSVGPSEHLLKGRRVAFVGSAEGIHKMASFTEDCALPVRRDRNGLALRPIGVSWEVPPEGSLYPRLDGGSGVGIRQVSAFSEQCAIEMHWVLAHTIALVDDSDKTAEPASARWG